MQDRFKFRYFNKYANKMVEPTNYENVDSVFECIKQQVCFDSNISPLPYDHIGNGLVFMQCTGLKDKNGKLIYEGDILNYSCLAGYSDIYTCTFNNGSFLIGGLLISNTHLKSEVIGNIYENPELLEV